MTNIAIPYHLDILVLCSRSFYIIHTFTKVIQVPELVIMLAVNLFLISLMTLIMMIDLGYSLEPLLDLPDHIIYDVL